MSEPLTRLIAQADRAEDSLARFQTLSTMNAADLARILGGDPAEAAPWVRAAAAHGVTEAQVRLGRMLLHGTGIARNEQAAYRWFLRAARENDADAMNMVGRCHENGWGAPASDEAATCWYRRAADAGNDWGEYNYAHMLFDGRGGARRDRAAAFAYYARAAARGHVRAMNLVGRCLEAGWGIAPDPAQAAIWYERSARGGYFRAQYNHGVILLEQGRIDEACHWLKEARLAGDTELLAKLDGLIAKNDKLHPVIATTNT